MIFGSRHGREQWIGCAHLDSLRTEHFTSGRTYPAPIEPTGRLPRRNRFAANVWKWYLLPFVPGLLAVIAVPLLRQPPEKWIGVWPVILLWAAMFYAIWRLNKRGADKLKHQIDELNSMNRESL